MHCCVLYPTQLYPTLLYSTSSRLVYTATVNADGTTDTNEDAVSEKEKEKESEEESERGKEKESDKETEREKERGSELKRLGGVSEIGVVNMAYYVSLGFLTSAGSGENTNLIEVS